MLIVLDSVSLVCTGYALDIYRKYIVFAHCRLTFHNQLSVGRHLEPVAPSRLPRPDATGIARRGTSGRPRDSGGYGTAAILQCRRPGDAASVMRGAHCQPLLVGTLGRTLKKLFVFYNPIKRIFAVSKWSVSSSYILWYCIKKCFMVVLFLCM